MFGLLAGIVALIAAGGLVAYCVVLTFRWLKDKIKKKFENKNVKKVAVMDLGEIISSCSNECSFSEFEKLADQGYTHVTATVDYDGNVDEVETIKDTSDTIDEEINQFINSTGDGMVVITR